MIDQIREAGEGACRRQLVNIVEDQNAGLLPALELIQDILEDVYGRLSRTDGVRRNGTDVPERLDDRSDEPTVGVVTALERPPRHPPVVQACDPTGEQCRLPRSCGRREKGEVARQAGCQQ